MMWWDQDQGWGWFGMSLAMLVFWGAVIWLVILLTGTWSKADPPPPPRRAEDVLAERFARGDIQGIEYQDRLRVLQGMPGDRSGAP